MAEARTLTPQVVALDSAARSAADHFYRKSLSILTDTKEGIEWNPAELEVDDGATELSVTHK